MQTISRNNKYQPIIIAIIAQIIFTLFIFTYVNNTRILNEKEDRTKVLSYLTNVKSRIEKSLYSRIYYTKGVAANISINSDISNAKFYELAEQFIQSDSVIGTMALSKDCIIGAIYPFKGHESAIGLNLLSHPKRREIVDKTIQTKKTFIAGPVELIEGGQAFISYTPIFDKVKDTNHFWGVTDIVILKEKLFNEADFRTSDSLYNYAIKGVDGAGLDGACFWGTATVFESNPIKVEILLPTGSWVLACAPINGWANYYKINDNLNLILYSGSLVISLLILLFSNAVFKIRTNELKLSTLFASMKDVIIEINKDGICTYIAPTNQNYLQKPASYLLGKSIYDALDKDTANLIINGINECLINKEMVTIDFPMMVKSNQFWFQARLSYISDDLLIFVAINNTKNIEAEKILKQSEIKLKELNETKDKFFSIIAHDLRGPLGNLKVLLNILKDTDSDLNDEERVEFLQVLENSASNLFALLENLLQWSTSQKGSIVFQPDNINISNIINETISVLLIAAKNKNITVSNNVKENTFVIADFNMINTILRNIISNAIKFTKSGGKIEVNSQLKDQFLEISISDNGIGIPNDIIDKLFKIENKVTTSGTNKELGTGLGLILSSEFIEKHNGKIWVESELGKGSTFTFSIPIL